MVWIKGKKVESEMKVREWFDKYNKFKIIIKNLEI